MVICVNPEGLAEAMAAFLPQRGAIDHASERSRSIQVA